MKEKVQNKEIIVEKVSSDDNLADFFTKALDRERFERLRAEIQLGKARNKNEVKFRKTENPTGK